MSELSIKVVIAGMTFPLTIKMEEEEVVRKAANEINELFQSFQSKYAVKDKQSILAMIALQFATQIHSKQIETEALCIGDRLGFLNDLIESSLEEK